MTEPNPDVGTRIAKGATWLVGLRWALRLLGIVNLIILARLLDPRDFGIAALAVAVANVLEQMSEFRTDLALIHNREAERAHYDTAWTLMLIRGVLLAVIISASAGPVAAFLEEPRLEACIYVLAAATLIESAKNVGTVDFFKGLQLDRQFKMTMVSRLSGFVVTVAVALLLRSYWALIAGFATYRLMLTVTSFVMHPYRPRLDLSKLRDIFGFSAWLWANSVLNYIAFASDIFVLGKMTDAGITGIYSVGRRVGQLVGSEFVGPVRNALFPGFVELVRDWPRFQKGFVDSFGIILAVGLPTTIGLALVAEPFTLVFLGDKWLPSVPIMQILAIEALSLLIVANSQSAFFALGRPDLWTWVLATRALVVIPALIIAIDAYGAVGAALANVAAGAAALPVALFFVKRKVAIRGRQIAAATWRSVVAALVMAGVVLAIRAVWPGEDGALGARIGELVTLIGAGIGSYVALHWMLWRASGSPEGPEHHVWTLVGPRVRRLRSVALTRRKSSV